MVDSYEKKMNLLTANWNLFIYLLHRWWWWWFVVLVVYLFCFTLSLLICNDFVESEWKASKREWTTERRRERKNQSWFHTIGLIELCVCVCALHIYYEIDFCLNYFPIRIFSSPLILILTSFCTHSISLFLPVSLFQPVAIPCTICNFIIWCHQSLNESRPHRTTHSGNNGKFDLSG